ncbi:FAD-binding oxidoreductase [Abyssibius alkaniclasticus]|uniref:NAD(P)/FAD-dependent oxidoreductase n=1 Tax=Abyssibius alkaniclasticus TaxID=2881234 RepID=UPI002363F24F|nr:FAD-binding oxidoreductase [Abyssibius alkaniclasticus]UPH72613.1 FAD-binding oxidoreductase [Abyssibius alkaniclasticus]
MPANQPSRQNYDVVIIGGGIMGASTAWFLTDTPDFDGTVLVVERDPSYATASTTHTNSCMRQQFSDPLNVQISQFAAAFIKDLRTNMGGDERVPNLSVQNFGYLYLADNEGFADVLRANQKVQLAAGAQTQLLDASALKAAYPFYQLDDIILGSINRKDEGFFDGSTLFDWWRRQSRERGVEYVRGEVVAVNRDAGGQRVASVTLGDGTVLGCGQVVNAAGPRAALVAKMAGLSVPVEPRKRFTWVFKAENPLDQPLPLTIDPSGVHFRENGGGTYMAGGHGDVDPAVDFDDFAMDFNLWESHVWPVIATRIPQFEAIKVQSEWAGHYAYNTFDQNAIVGPHPELPNFIFLNGFSGHGLQQSAAMGRGTAEWLTYGAFRSLDLSPLRYERILRGQPLWERAVI